MIIAIDPGVTHCGITVQREVSEGIVEILYRENVRGARTLKTERLKLIETQQGTRTAKIMRITDVIMGLIEHFGEPEYIVFEAPFYARRSPNAYGSLLEVIDSVKYVVGIPLSIPIALFEPSVIKKCFAKHGGTKKLGMQEALLERIEEGTVILGETVTLAGISEHEIDSAGIGYTLYNYKRVPTAVEKKNTVKKKKSKKKK